MNKIFLIFFITTAYIVSGEFEENKTIEIENVQGDSIDPQLLSSTSTLLAATGDQFNATQMKNHELYNNLLNIKILYQDTQLSNKSSNNHNDKNKRMREEVDVWYSKSMEDVRKKKRDNNYLND